MTIEELLNPSDPSIFSKIEILSQEELREYLKDVTSLEPKSFGRIIIDDSCPIKSPKKSKKKFSSSISDEIEKMKKEIEGL